MPQLALGLAATSLLVSGCSAAATKPAAPAAPVAETVPTTDSVARLTFAWTVPARAWVTVTSIDKDGGTSVIRHEMIVEREKASGKVLVSFAHFSVVALAGVDLNDAAAREDVRKVEALSSAALSLRVSGDGRNVEAIGLDELVARLPAMITDKPDEQAALADLVRGQRPLLVAAATESWDLWVKTWLVSGVRPGARVTVTQRFPLPDGSTTAAPVVYTWVGADKALPGQVDLRFDTVLDGDALRLGTERLIAQELARHPPPGPPPSIPALASLVRASHGTVVTDPANLRMSSASKETVTTARGKDGKSVARREKQSYRFDWE